MAIYRYQHGDRPLEGFTIQHGLGRGGFGEVYYAISDAGREVALKSVQNYEDIELRGIKHCMNLKHPQLVSIFDIKHTDDGLPFVVMEYIDGPSLRDILDSHPEGLGAAKAAFFLKEIAKGLSYLHDCGVVHRDLKPHNVFYEQGVVKIGDYSLSKAISMGHRSGHTMTVGTVHYMAPEISVGRYDHTVDVYALGVMLYEMLTGSPPFVGQSMGEVLMKHVAGDVEIDGIEEPFARVIKKSLAKEPLDRYQSAQEMVDDLMGHPALQQSVASLGPETLTVIANQAMKASKQTPPAVPQQPAATAAYVRTPASKPIHAATPSNRISGSQRGRILKRLVTVAAVGIAFFMAVGLSGEARHPLPLLAFLIVGFVIWKKKRRKAVWHAEQVAPPAPPSAPRPYQPTPAARPVMNKAPKFAHAVDVDAARLEIPIEESPYSRLVALIMSCVALIVPVAGLQRLYVGRVKTGLLWFFTFGLLGIGQIFDTVMIALGQFRDADGKRVLNFTRESVNAMKQPVNEYSNVVRHQWTESRIGFKLGNLVANMIGAVLLLIALGAGAVMAVDIPKGIAAGAFGKDLMQHMANGTQMSDWNILVAAALGLIALVTGLLATVCLIFSRRESNWVHMLRIPVAAAAFVGSITSLGSVSSFGSRWDRVADYVLSEQVGGAVLYVQRTFWPGAIIGGVLFVAAIFILAWPAKRRVPAEAQTPAQPVEAREGQKA